MQSRDSAACKAGRRAPLQSRDARLFCMLLRYCFACLLASVACSGSTTCCFPATSSPGQRSADVLSRSILRPTAQVQVPTLSIVCDDVTSGCSQLPLDRIPLPAQRLHAWSCICPARSSPPPCLQPPLPRRTLPVPRPRRRHQSRPRMLRAGPRPHHRHHRPHLWPPRQKERRPATKR